MVLALKNIEDVEKVQKVLADRKSKKGFDAKKFCGTLKVNQDALAIQRHLRNEWN